MGMLRSEARHLMDQFEAEIGRIGSVVIHPAKALGGSQGMMQELSTTSTVTYPYYGCDAGWSFQMLEGISRCDMVCANTTHQARDDDGRCLCDPGTTSDTVIAANETCSTNQQCYGDVTGDAPREALRTCMPGTTTTTTTTTAWRTTTTVATTGTTTTAEPTTTIAATTTTTTTWSRPTPVCRRSESDTMVVAGASTWFYDGTDGVKCKQICNSDSQTRDSLYRCLCGGAAPNDVCVTKAGDPKTSTGEKCSNDNGGYCYESWMGTI